MLFDILSTNAAPKERNMKFPFVTRKEPWSVDQLKSIYGEGKTL